MILKISTHEISLEKWLKADANCCHLTHDLHPFECYVTHSFIKDGLRLRGGWLDLGYAGRGGGAQRSENLSLLFLQS